MIRTQDGFTNFEASLGFGADTLSSHARYTLNPQSRNGQQLATAYRGSWIVVRAIDAPAEDMTRAAIDLSGIEPEAIEALDLAFQRLAQCRTDQSPRASCLPPARQSLCRQSTSRDMLSPVVGHCDSADSAYSAPGSTDCPRQSPATLQNW